MRFDVVTLFPPMFAAVTESGITSRALAAGLWSLKTWNPRDFTTDNYRTVDDRPFGGGPGMVMLVEPLAKALEAARAAGAGRVIYLSPQGRKLDHRRVIELADWEIEQLGERVFVQRAARSRQWPTRRQPSQQRQLK